MLSNAVRELERTKQIFQAHRKIKKEEIGKLICEQICALKSAKFEDLIKTMFSSNDTLSIMEISKCSKEICDRFSMSDYQTIVSSEKGQSRLIVIFTKDLLNPFICFSPKGTKYKPTLFNYHLGNSNRFSNLNVQYSLINQDCHIDNIR